MRTKSNRCTISGPTKARHYCRMCAKPYATRPLADDCCGGPEAWTRYDDALLDAGINPETYRALPGVELREIDEPCITSVIFRRFPKSEGGDVIALFPEIPSETNDSGYCCVSYQRVGQHGGASPQLMHTTRPADMSEADTLTLACELASLGYCLTVRHKFTHRMQRTREREAARILTGERD